MSEKLRKNKSGDSAEMSKRDKGKRINLAPGALTSPLPPALVTVGDMEDSNVLTIAWTGILSTVPPRTYISVRPSRHSYGILKERGEFVINLASADMARNVDFAGIYTGKKMDKFERCGLTKVQSEKVLAPTIAQCPLALECKVFDVIPMGSHDVFMADIVSVSCREDIMSADGRMMLDKAGLLAYAHGEYFALGEKLGKFGFSTDKDKKEPNSKKDAQGKGDSANKKVSLSNMNNAYKKDAQGKKDSANKKVSLNNKDNAYKKDAQGKKDSLNKKRGVDAERFDDRKKPKAVLGEERGLEKNDFEDDWVPRRKATSKGHGPFYLGLPKGKAKRKPEGAKDKGRPHGRKTEKKGDKKV